MGENNVSVIPGVKLQMIILTQLWPYSYSFQESPVYDDCIIMYKSNDNDMKGDSKTKE